MVEATRKELLMHRITAAVLGIVIGILAIAGMFVEGRHLMDVMNVDVALDVIRIVLAVALLIVAFARVPHRAVRTVLIVVGVLYVGMGLLAFIDPTLFGMLPTGLTGFDIAFHLIVGAATIAIAALPDRGWRADDTVSGRSTATSAR
jgi:hypothetical protein